MRIVADLAEEMDIEMTFIELWQRCPSLKRKYSFEEARNLWEKGEICSICGTNVTIEPLTGVRFCEKQD